MRTLLLFLCLLILCGHARAQPGRPLPAPDALVLGGVLSQRDSTSGVPGVELRFRPGPDTAAATYRARTGAQGAYQLALPGGRTYRVDAFRNGRRVARRDVPVPAADSTWANFYIDAPVATGIEEPAPAAYFGVRQTALRPWDREYLAYLVPLLRDHPQVRARVEGHADAREAPAHHPDPAGYLRRLSAHRARALADWLRAQGVPAAQLVVVGYGARRPAAPSQSAENRQLNRRVDLKPATAP